jgi:SAM-dependent methyltransferase
MTDTIIKIREHYSATGLTDRIKAALATITPEGQALTVAQLAPLDQFHTRGILATGELAAAARLDPSTRVLDLGCGLGGPARYLAATFGCKVTGIDLSPAFIDAGTYLTARSSLSDRVTFQVGNVLSWRGLVTYYVLFFILLVNRRVSVAGIFSSACCASSENFSLSFGAPGSM